MSRHRNVRSMNYSDEYEGYDDVYGHSVEDDYTISPSDAAFMYDRSTRQPQMSIYLKGEEDIAEEDEQAVLEQQNKTDNVKLNTCLEEVKNVLGNTFPEQAYIKMILEKNYDTAKVVNALLNKTTLTKKDASDSPKPQRLTSLRSTERGGSRDTNKEESTGNSEKAPQDFSATKMSIINKMDLGEPYKKKYKSFVIDFTQTLINNIDISDNTKKIQSEIENKPISSNDSIIFCRNSKNISTSDGIINTNSKKYFHPLYTSHLSKIGFYLCMKYLKTPKILKLRKETQDTIKPFKFDTRSPDDIVKRSCIIKKSEHKIKF